MTLLPTSPPTQLPYIIFGRACLRIILKFLYKNTFLRTKLCVQALVELHSPQLKAIGALEKVMERFQVAIVGTTELLVAIMVVGVSENNLPTLNRWMDLNGRNVPRGYGSADCPHVLACTGCCASSRARCAVNLGSNESRVSLRQRWIHSVPCYLSK